MLLAMFASRVNAVRLVLEYKFALLCRNLNNTGILLYTSKTPM